MKSTDRTRIHIPIGTAATMVWSYARGRILEQVKSVAFIILYLLAFQLFVLGSTPSNAVRVAAGLGLVILGLTFFLEGLILGLMPLGERVGVRLPRKCGIFLIVVFGLLLGMGSTYAEPAIATLSTAGVTVTAWGSPLLYRMLNDSPGLLVASIALGVGVAVGFGMFRFYYGFSIKPFIYTLVPILLGLSVYCALDSNLRNILGLAWDAGAVTTGAVPVPLVLALGIGVSRASGKREDAAGGFGIIMLASAFPIMGVMILGIVLNPSTSRPMEESAFFAPEYRERALRLFPNEAALLRHVFQHGGEDGRKAFFGEDEEGYRQALRRLGTPEGRGMIPDSMSAGEWLTRRASETERAFLTREVPGFASSPRESETAWASVFRQESTNALRAVIPLTLLLAVVLFLMLRDRPRHVDEVALGVGLALVGMMLLTTGIRTGLAPLGDEVGRPLPRVFRSVPREEGRVILEPFEPEQVLTGFTPEGRPYRFFYFTERGTTPRPVPFDDDQFDPETGSYEHVLQRPPLFGPQLTLVGIAMVFLFAFGLGFGSTQAEPALSALGRTVEELTVGTIKRSGVVRAVSLGVGIGLMMGVARILYDIPIVWLLLPPYMLLLPLTYWSEEDFAGIAWDCGGVTTGGITVPLVLAMGLGIGGELNVTDGFGVLAMASAYPILTVLLFGMMVRARQRKGLVDVDEEDEDE
ncbi:MAG: DUF1538 domain-containing protein [Kiritimatiellae bacterium]|nr:DUF1538 domain-containing protein [Kiritimatiellia bacterium]